jgi:hypothetical protein
MFDMISRANNRKLAYIPCRLSRGKKGGKKINRSFIDVGMPVDGHHHGGSFQPSKKHMTNSLPSASLNKSAVVPCSRVVSPFLFFDQQET